ncbi:laminin G domain containing protein [Nitzschia inconspicua]|uniref:Laminin G domain containing protein n=1 Tax=Nitzschia inconspicua TaxID=303405 RepID=A0A9K3M2K1_9STRA|nr:laminin G domain containing protein [Nitzschia inconspicua]
MRELRFKFQADSGLVDDSARQGREFLHLFNGKNNDNSAAEFSNNSDQVDELVKPAAGKTGEMNHRGRLLRVGGLLLMLIISTTIGRYVTFRRRSRMTASIGSFCQPPSIKDTKEPIIKLTLFSGMERLVDWEEAEILERAVMEGYNEASGGCRDEYERWIYGTKLVNQSLIPLYYVNRHENGTLSTTFAKEYTHVVQFQTVISCNGCSDEEAFASYYPESFGDLTDDNFHRHLHLDESRTLSAGLILNEIERKIAIAVPDIGRIGEVSISTEQDAKAKHMRSSYFGEEMADEDECAEILLPNEEDEEVECCSSECTTVNGQEYCREICTPGMCNEEKDAIPSCCQEFNCRPDPEAAENTVCDMDCRACSTDGKENDRKESVDVPDGNSGTGSFPEGGPSGKKGAAPTSDVSGVENYDKLSTGSGKSGKKGKLDNQEDPSFTSVSASGAGESMLSGETHYYNKEGQRRVTIKYNDAKPAYDYEFGEFGSVGSGKKGGNDKGQTSSSGSYYPDTTVENTSDEGSKKGGYSGGVTSTGSYNADLDITYGNGGKKGGYSGGNDIDSAFGKKGGYSQSGENGIDSAIGKKGGYSGGQDLGSASGKKGGYSGDNDVGSASGNKGDTPEGDGTSTIVCRTRAPIATLQTAEPTIVPTGTELPIISLTTREPTMVPTSTELPILSLSTTEPTMVPTSTEPPIMSLSTTEPTIWPSESPTEFPTYYPTETPTELPTSTPTFSPSISPTFMPMCVENGMECYFEFSLDECCGSAQCLTAPNGVMICTECGGYGAPCGAANPNGVDCCDDLVCGEMSICEYTALPTKAPSTRPSQLLTDSLIPPVSTSQTETAAPTPSPTCFEDGDICSMELSFDECCGSAQCLSCSEGVMLCRSCGKFGSPCGAANPDGVDCCDGLVCGDSSTCEYTALPTKAPSPRPSQLLTDSLIPPVSTSQTETAAPTPSPTCFEDGDICSMELSFDECCGSAQCLSCSEGVMLCRSCGKFGSPCGAANPDGVDCCDGLVCGDSSTCEYTALPTKAPSPRPSQLSTDSLIPPVSTSQTETAAPTPSPTCFEDGDICSMELSFDECCGSAQCLSCSEGVMLCRSCGKFGSPCGAANPDGVDCCDGLVCGDSSTCEYTVPPTTNSPTAWPVAAFVTVSPTALPSSSPRTNSPTISPSNAPSTCTEDPCRILEEGSLPDNACDSCIPWIKISDSWCTKNWDKWCVSLYASCCPHANCDASIFEEVPMSPTCPPLALTETPDEAMAYP